MRLIHLPDKLPKSVQATLPTFFDIREGESKECFLAAFLMLYLLSLALRASRAHEAERS